VGARGSCADFARGAFDCIVFQLSECLPIIARVLYTIETLRKRHKQASSVVKLGFAALDVAEATKKVVEATHSARQPELLLEVRACVDRVLPWCDKVRNIRVVKRSRATKFGVPMLRMRRLRIFFAAKDAAALTLSSPSSLSTDSPYQQGFPVAHVQLPLPVQDAPSTSPGVPLAAAGGLEASNFPGGITIKGAGVEIEVRFCRLEGEEVIKTVLFAYSFLHLPRHRFHSSSLLLIVVCVLLRKHWLECHSDDSNSRPTHSQQVSSATGVVTRWAVAGTEILAEPIVPCFYRAPTDNDRGGSGGNSHANRCGFGSKKRGSNFRGPGSISCAGAPCQSTTTVGFCSSKQKTLLLLSHLPTSNTSKSPFIPLNRTGGRRQASTAWPWCLKRSSWRRKRPRKVASRCVFAQKMWAFPAVFRRFEPPFPSFRSNLFFVRLKRQNGIFGAQDVLEDTSARWSD